MTRQTPGSQTDQGLWWVGGGSHGSHVDGVVVMVVVLVMVLVVLVVSLSKKIKGTGY